MTYRPAPAERPSTTFRPVSVKSAVGRPGPGIPRRRHRADRPATAPFRGLFATRLRSSAGWYDICRTMSFLDHIRRCNNADLGEFEPWFIGAQRAGFLHRDFAPLVGSRSRLFTRRDKRWHLDSTLDTPQKRSAAVRDFLLELREQGHFGSLWRAEDYPVTWEFTDPPLMTMERAAVPWFGVRAFGPHMTGYVRRKDGLHVWVPRR